MSVVSGVTRRLKAAHLARKPLASVTKMLQARPGAMILCWHAIGSDLPGYPFRTSPQAFRSQITYLKDHFEIVALEKLVARLADGITAPVVALTFDDGFTDNLTTATPILEEMGVPATLFVPRDLIRGDSETFMSEKDVQTLSAHPLWQIGAHGLTHNILPGFLPSDQRRELEGSRDWLANLIGKRPDFFAYPQGAIDVTSVALAAELFDAAFTTDRRLTDSFDRAQVRRFCPRIQHDDLGSFARGLYGAPVEQGKP